MLRSVNALQRYTLAATDGELGKVHDCLFDDESWVIRYLAMDTGRWLPGRKVLLRPSVLGQSDWLQQVLPVELSQEQIRQSPELDADKPVSRQHEISLARHYGWPQYWTEPSDLPGVFTPGHSIPVAPPQSESPEKAEGDPHLRSTREVCGYHLQATDGEIGHVDDFILDDESWHIRYVVAATRNWLPGKKVLLAPEWLVAGIHWDTAEVHVDLTRDQVRNSPEYDPSAPVNRKYELTLYDFYGRPGYWVRDRHAKELLD